MTDEQILPTDRDGHVAAHNRLGRRLTLLQEQVDALSSLENVTRKRLDELYERFYRHTHTDAVSGENAVKASVEAEESVRHDG